MGISGGIDAIEQKIQGSSPNYIEIAATLMPKRMTGIKHMLRPACNFLPMPMSLGWQENPVDDDYPQDSLVKGLQLTDIDSGATRPVTAPWMHALYTSTMEEQVYGVTELKLKEAQFHESITWQHRAMCCVLLAQAIFGIWAMSAHKFREGTFILLGVLLQLFEGWYARAFPVHLPPRKVAKRRTYALHKGMTTSHILIIYHQPKKTRARANEKPYINLEDAAVPMPILRKGYKRILELGIKRGLQLANIILRLGCVLSKANGLLIPITLLIGTLASEIVIAIRTPLPRYSSRVPLDTAKRHMSMLDMVLATCQMTGCRSIGFVEALLPDKDGRHIDFGWICDVLDKGVLAAGPHPHHQTRNVVFSSALRRRTFRDEDNSTRND